MSFVPPLRPGDIFFVPWRVTRVDPAEGAVLVRMESDRGGAVTLGIGTEEGHSGPFDRAPFWIHYRDETVPYADFERAARTLGELLEATMPAGIADVRRWLGALGGAESQRRSSGSRLNLVVSLDTIDQAEAWCERQYEAGAESVELVVPGRGAPPWVAVRALVTRLARRWAGMPMRIHWRSQIGAPLCVFPGELGEVLLREPGRIHVPDGTAFGDYAPSCAECALRLACPGVADETLTTGLAPFSASHARSSPLECAWQDAARWLLTEQPGRRLRLGDLVPEAALPAIPCHLPWTQLQLGTGGVVTPCSPENARLRGRRTEDEGVEALWHGDVLRLFRRALALEDQPETCSPSCPMLRDGSRAPRRVELWGGRAAFVEAQIGICEALLSGSEAVPAPPLNLQISALSACDFDCIMCRCGALGTRADELPERFWEDLRGTLPLLRTLLLTGGEPLLSQPLRCFLPTLRAADLPDLRIALLTNGASLDDELLEALRETPLADVQVGLNAASAERYAAINRGVDWATIRSRLDALLAWRARWRPATTIAFGMVLMPENADELAAFEALADDAGAVPRVMSVRG